MGKSVPISCGSKAEVNLLILNIAFASQITTKHLLFSNLGLLGVKICLVAQLDEDWIQFFLGRDSRASHA